MGAVLYFRKKSNVRVGQRSQVSEVVTVCREMHFGFDDSDEGKPSM